MLKAKSESLFLAMKGKIDMTLRFVSRGGRREAKAQRIKSLGKRTISWSRISTDAKNS
jgi:hypothetical protein